MLKKMCTESTCHVGKQWDRGFESAKVKTKLKERANEKVHGTES